MPTRITPNMDTFYAVLKIYFIELEEYWHQGIIAGNILY